MYNQTNQSYEVALASQLAMRTKGRILRSNETPTGPAVLTKQNIFNGFGQTGPAGEGGPAGAIQLRAVGGKSGCARFGSPNSGTTVC
jgi:hypothetical protein